MSKQLNVKEVNGQIALQPNIAAPFGYTLWVMANYSVSKISEFDYYCGIFLIFIRVRPTFEFPEKRARNRSATNDSIAILCGVQMQFEEQRAGGLSAEIGCAGQVFDGLHADLFDQQGADRQSRGQNQEGRIE
jgi:hypothetical protein